MSENKYSQFLNLLNQGEEFTYVEACKQLGVSTKQVRRYIHHALKNGVPVQAKRESRCKVFFIPNELREPGFRIDLTPDELLALTVAANAASDSLRKTPLGDPLSSGIAKLIQQFPEQLIPLELDEPTLSWNFSNNPMPEVDPDIFRCLMDTIHERKQIIVDYFSASRNEPSPNRKLDPYAIALRGSSWLLVAWCYDRESYRDFSIPAITNIRVQDHYFRWRDDFDREEHFKGRFHATGGKQYTVRLHVEADRVPWFRRKKYHPSQQLIAQEDGSAIAEYTVAGLEDIRSFAQGWGNGVLVLEPQELVDIMRAHVQTLHKRYGGRTNDP